MTASPHTERCPLCGYEFDATAARCRPGCPLAAGCTVVCCPECGYGFPRETSGLAARLRAALDALGRGRTAA